MTTHRTYTCNLCRDKIEPTEFAQKEGFGVRFVIGGDIEFLRAADAENHICLQCAREVHDALRKVTPAAQAEEVRRGR